LEQQQFIADFMLKRVSRLQPFLFRGKTSLSSIKQAALRNKKHIPDTNAQKLKLLNDNRLNYSCVGFAAFDQKRRGGGR
jgi:hypothetical protein